MKKKTQILGHEYESDNKELKDNLAMRVFDLFKNARMQRTNTNILGRSIDDWINRLNRAYNKIHEVEELQDRPKMSTYFGLIHTKSNMVGAFIKGQYVSFKNYPFSLNPTPIVELPSDLQDQAFKIVQGKVLDVMVKNGLAVDNLVENGFLRQEVVKFISQQAKLAKQSLREEEMKIAKKAADEMATLIKDQFTHGKFDEAMAQFVDNIALYPAAFLALDYVLTTDNKWEKNKFVRYEEVKLQFRSIHPKNAFPSSDYSGNGGSYFIEVMQRSRAELAGFIGSKDLGFIDDAIKDVLRDGNLNWLNENAAHQPICRHNDLIDVLRCQMMISGSDLLDYGVPLEELGLNHEEDAHYKFFNADVDVCSNRVIRVQMIQTPHGKRSYFMASYKTTGNSIWGISPAMMIYDRQLSVNRVHYAMALNVFHSAGPSAEILSSAFDNPREVTLLPYSVVLSSAETERAGGGVRFHQVTPTFHMLYNQLINEIRLADEECGLPSFLNGSAGLRGAGKTLGGLALMQDNAIMGIKECFSNIDMYIIRPIVELMRDNNLEDGNNLGIRGDCDVVATGLLGLEQDVEKARAMAGLMPNVLALERGGMIPKELAQEFSMDYMAEQGIDVSKYNTPNISGALGNMVSSRTPDPMDKLDGRSLSQM